VKVTGSTPRVPKDKTIYGEGPGPVGIYEWWSGLFGFEAPNQALYEPRDHRNRPTIDVHESK
jgi:hypothetical protein